MNNNFCASPDYEVVAGSRLYGISNANSDYDFRGFVVAPCEIRPSLFETFESKNYQTVDIENIDPSRARKDKIAPVVADHVVYSLAKFLKLCSAGQINILEILWSPQYKATAVGEIIRESRSLFISKSIYRSIRGFALSEFHRAFISSIVPKEQYADKTKAFLDSLTAFQLRSFEILSMRQHLEEILGKDLVETIEQPERVEAKRREMYEAYGYDTKSAANAIRLLDQGTELLLDSNITFPCREAKLLRDIRDGKIEKKTLKTLFAYYEDKLDQAYKITTAPAVVDRSKIDNLYAMGVGMAQIRDEDKRRDSSSLL